MKKDTKNSVANVLSLSAIGKNGLFASYSLPVGEVFYGWKGLESHKLPVNISQVYQKGRIASKIAICGAGIEVLETIAINDAAIAKSKKGSEWIECTPEEKTSLLAFIKKNAGEVEEKPKTVRRQRITKAADIPVPVPAPLAAEEPDTRAILIDLQKNQATFATALAAIAKKVGM